MLCPSENIRVSNQIIGGVTSRKSYHANVGGPGCISAYSGIFTPQVQDWNGSTGGFNGIAANANCSVVDMATITDGTSNTAMLSENHVGAGPAANTVTIGTVNGRGDTYMWRPASGQQTTGMDLGPAGVGIALAFVQSCQGIPGKSSGLRPAFSAQRMRLDRRQPRLVHVVGRLQPLHAPQHDRVRLDLGREYRRLWLDRRRISPGQQPSWRRQYGHGRWFGQVHQELGQSPDLVGAGNQKW